MVEGECEMVGPTCEAGWADDGECGCAPVLDDCATDEIALVGGGCAVVGPADSCGTGTWGDIPDTTSTLYVDASFSGAGDGSRTSPYATIAEAVTAATPGSTIAIAAGTYREAVRVDAPLHVLGRCSSMVTIAPPGGSWSVRLGADGSSLTSVTLDCAAGVSTCVRLDGAEDLVVEDVVVTTATDAGIYCHDCTAAVRRSSVLDVDPSGVSTNAYGIAAFSSDGSGCSLLVERCDVRNAARLGLFANDCEGSFLQNRITAAGETGIRARASSGIHVVEIVGNLVTGCSVAGISTSEFGGRYSTLTITHNRIEDTRFDPAWTGGSQAAVNLMATMSSLTYAENVIDASEVDGATLFMAGGEAQIASNLVRDVLGRGIEVQDAAAGETGQNTVSGAGQVGIRVAHGSLHAVRHNTVRAVAESGVPAGSRAIDITDHMGPVAEGNVVSSALEGIYALSCTSDIRIASNLIDVDRFAVLVADHPGHEPSVAIVTNRLTGASGIAAWDCPTCSVSVAANMIGPLGGVLTSTEGASFHLGVYLEAVMVADVRDNLVEMNPGTAAEVWNEGIYVKDSCGSITGNRVSGSRSIGIVFSDEASIGCTDVDMTGNVVASGAGVGLLLSRTIPAGATTVSRNVVAGIDDTPWPEGNVFGDGIAIINTEPASPVAMADNVLVANGRVGVFVSRSSVALVGHSILANAIGMAWQDGAVVTVEGSEIACNDSDQPWVDQGMSVPASPDLGMPSP